MQNEKVYESKRKFAWVDKWAKMTGERAMIDAKVYNTYIIYNSNGKLVKKYPDGTILPLKDNE